MFLFITAFFSCWHVSKTSITLSQGTACVPDVPLICNIGSGCTATHNRLNKVQNKATVTPLLFPLTGGLHTLMAVTCMHMRTHTNIYEFSDY